ncbi:MAG: PTS transporter subunit EIIC [Oscillospiraceae bacterium]
MRLFIYKRFGYIFVDLQKLAQALLLPLVFVQMIIILEWLGMYVESIGLFAWRLEVYVPVIFAVGVAIGVSEHKDSLTGFCAVIFCFASMSIVSRNNFTMQSFYGMFCGVCMAKVYDGLKDVRMPKRFLFLKKEHLIVLMTIIMSLVTNFLILPVVLYFDQFGATVWDLINGRYEVAAMINGFCNRLLIPLGLHHLLYGFVSFQLGRYNEVQGEVLRYTKGDKTAGFIMSGFYPVSISGLSAAALAIFCRLPKDERQKYKGTFFTTTLATLVTGVTEPIEYLFVFTSPVLYLIHAGLAGLSCFISAAAYGKNYL